MGKVTSIIYLIIATLSFHTFSSENQSHISSLHSTAGFSYIFMDSKKQDKTEIIVSVYHEHADQSYRLEIEFDPLKHQLANAFTGKNIHELPAPLLVEIYDNLETILQETEKV